MDINKWSVDGITPIMVAAIEGHDLAVEQLLIKGAKLDICDKGQLISEGNFSLVKSPKSLTKFFEVFLP